MLSHPGWIGACSPSCMLRNTSSSHLLCRHRGGGFRHLPAPLDGSGAHLPPALLPPVRSVLVVFLVIESFSVVALSSSSPALLGSRWRAGWAGRAGMCHDRVCALSGLTPFPPRRTRAHTNNNTPQSTGAACVSVHCSNLMSEFMGLVRGQYDAKADGFLPGALRCACSAVLCCAMLCLGAHWGVACSWQLHVLRPARDTGMCAGHGTGLC